MTDDATINWDMEEKRRSMVGNLISVVLNTLMVSWVGDTDLEERRVIEAELKGLGIIDI